MWSILPVFALLGLTQFVIYRHDHTTCTSLVASSEDWSNGVGNAMLEEARNQAFKSASIASFGVLDNTRGGGCYIYLYDVQCVLVSMCCLWCISKYNRYRTIIPSEPNNEEMDMDNGPPQYGTHSKTPDNTTDNTPDNTPVNTPKKHKKPLNTPIRQRLTINTGFINDLGLIA